MKAIFIDAAKREICEVDYVHLKEDGKSLHDWLNGYIESAWTWRNGDVLWVDGDGYSKPQRHFFRLSLRADGQPLAGSGILTGREIEDDSKHGYHTEPPIITIAEITPLITWMTRSDVDQWGMAKGGEAAITLTTLDHGKASREILQSWGQLIGNMPPTNLYRTTIRPAHGGGVPAGLRWEYIEAPAMHGLVNRPDLPVSQHRYGVIRTERPLTVEEREHFDILPVD